MLNPLQLPYLIFVDEYIMKQCIFFVTVHDELL